MGAEAAEPILCCIACGSAYFERPISRPHDYDSYYPYLSGFDAARYRWELEQRRRIFRFQLQTIERMNPPGRRLIEFGAGSGYFCAIAGEMGWRATAIEVSPPAIDAGRREFGVDYGTLESVPKEGCDVITAFHVLEHLESPASLMQVFREKLTLGGVLVVHVPNRESLSALIHHGIGKLAGRSRDRRGVPVLSGTHHRFHDRRPDALRDASGLRTGAATATIAPQPFSRPAVGPQLLL